MLKLIVISLPVSVKNAVDWVAFGTILFVDRCKSYPFCGALVGACQVIVALVLVIDDAIILFVATT